MRETAYFVLMLAVFCQACAIKWQKDSIANLELEVETLQENVTTLKEWYYACDSDI